MPVRTSKTLFLADLKRFGGVTLPEAQRRVKRKIAFDLFGKLIERSPVDTGRFRGSWTMADGSPDLTVLPEGSHAGGGNRITATFADPFGHVWIANALPYAVALEHGHSQQAPLGMVSIAVAEIEAGFLSELAG